MNVTMRMFKRMNSLIHSAGGLEVREFPLWSDGCGFESQGCQFLVVVCLRDCMGLLKFIIIKLLHFLIKKIYDDNDDDIVIIFSSIVL